ncbi:DUF397 domain-containing protein [Actinomadura vinacea]|uniref:DUF397 domain-containing protein n=1 Tax=Actinomadura vinacea TaxID=115336 RepID=A0ABN3J021_9ACTN
MQTLDPSRAVWRKSAHSGGNGNCVEVAQVDKITALRDSKDPHGPVLAFSPQGMRSLLDDVKAKKYDL